MKKGYAPIITLAVAVVLVGSVAYAAEKRKKARLVVSDPGGLTEETLKAELLALPAEQHKKSRVQKFTPPEK
jgi:hypothetical protein